MKGSRAKKEMRKMGTEAPQRQYHQAMKSYQKNVKQRHMDMMS
jgi:hypothetical protein